MRNEIYSADWSIPYPAHFDAEGVTKVLLPLTQVEHHWEVFPWYLVSRLVGLLETPAPCFEYLHATLFFRARAAMLVLTGDVLDRKEIFGALCRHRVQVGGIYRAHLLHYLRAYLKQQNFVQLPECECAEFNALRDPQQMEANRELMRRVVVFSETEYLNTLSLISLATDMEEVISLRPLVLSDEGAARPASVRVPVQTNRYEAGHDLAPVRDEAKEALRARRPVRKVAVRRQGELSGMGGKDEDGDLSSTGGSAGGGKPESEVRGPFDGAGSTSLTTSQGRRKSGEKGNDESREKKTGFEVIGDYRVIRIPGRREISLARKHKTRAVLRFIHMTLKKAGTTDFYVDEMRDAFNAQFTEEMAGKQWMSDRFREDLFKGKLEAFDLLFEPLDRASGHYRMKFCGWLAMLGLGALGNLGDGSWLMFDGGVWDWVQWGVGELRMWA